MSLFHVTSPKYLTSLWKFGPNSRTSHMVGSKHLKTKVTLQSRAPVLGQTVSVRLKLPTTRVHAELPSRDVRQHILHELQTQGQEGLHYL